MSVKFSIKSKRNPKFKRVQKGPIYKYTHANLVRFWKDAVVVFLDATLLPMQVDTGMSVASLYRTATKVNRANKLDLDISSKILKKAHRSRGPKKHWIDINGRYHSGVGKSSEKMRSIRHGLELGEKATEVLTFGTYKRPVFNFVFSITVWQHLMQDGDWDSILKGSAAMKKFLSTEIVNYIAPKNLLKYLTTSKIDKEIPVYEGK